MAAGKMVGEAEKINQALMGFKPLPPLYQLGATNTGVTKLHVGNKANLGSSQSVRQRGVRGMRGMRGMRGTQKIKKKLKKYI